MPASGVNIFIKLFQEDLPIRILYITTDAFGSSGGIAQYSRDVCAALSEWEQKPTVDLIQRSAGVFEYKKVPENVKLISKNYSGTFDFFISLIPLLSNKYDLVMCGHINLLPFAALFSRVNNAPLALFVYGIDVWNRPKKFYLRWFLSYITEIWTISSFTLKSMLSWFPFKNTPFQKLPNAINLNEYDNKISQCDVDRVRNGATKVILTLGRLDASEQYKGVDEILSILPRILEKFPDVKYWVAGTGSDLPRLKQRAMELNVQDNVIFFGYVSEQERLLLYNSCDVFAMPGFGEGFGFVFLEALACGAPVVASVLDGSYEAVRLGTIGYAVDPRDPNEVFETIIKAFNDSKVVPEGLGFFGFEEFKIRLYRAVDTLVDKNK